MNLRVDPIQSCSDKQHEQQQQQQREQRITVACLQVLSRAPRGGALRYLQRALRWDRSSITNVGEQTLAGVFIGPSPLAVRHFPFAPTALHTQQLSRPAERAALAWCFVEAPRRHCPQSPKVT